MANEKVNKVILGNETLIDLTGDTVSANSLLAGATAHDARGEQITGNVSVPTDLDDLGDVSITTPTEGQALVYDSTNDEWVNGDVEGDSIIYMTKAEYEQITPEQDQLYGITDWDASEPLKVTWSGSVSRLVGDTSVTITDSAIATTSVIEPFMDSASGKSFAPDTTTVTTGQVVYTFSALTEATTFKVRITNF